MDSSAYQLYHILNSGTLKYCLICMEEICDNLNFLSEENPIKIHLSCPNHQENVKFLFKLCIPDSIDDESGTEDSFHIMKSSVFDISHALGKNSCYICCKNKKHLVCVLCHEEISEMDFPCKKVKKKVVSHLQSDRHLKSVKDTNWIYHFNAYKSFFRFHKSLLYCSVCKESFQFKESNLLQFAESHLRYRHNVVSSETERDKPEHVTQAKGETKTSNCIYVRSLGSCNNSVSSSSSVLSSETSAYQSSDSSFPLRTKKTKSYTCHLCLGDIEITERGVMYSIDNHCTNNHLKCFQVQGASLVKDIICFNKRFVDHKVIVKRYPGIKVLSDCVPVFGNNSKYIQIFDKLCFCRLCSVTISFDTDPNNLLRNFSAHFHSDEHVKVSKRKGDTGYDKASKKKTKDLKRLKQSPKAEKGSKKLKKKKKKVDSKEVK